MDVARLTGASLGSVRRVEAETDVVQIDNDQERAPRQIGRPSKAEPFRPFVLEQLATAPDLLALKILHRAKLAGYPGGKSALYALVHAIRPRTPRPVVRFEGLPGEFSRHDFGQVDVRYLDGATQRIHFFAWAATARHR